MAAERILREAHPTEQAVGIDHYVSDADGIGGRLRESPEDFRVRELEAFDAEPPDADRGSYPELVVRATLRDWDTNDFARRLSDALGVSRERVSWAGTKDKRAVTTQLFTVRGVDGDELPEVRGAEVEALGRAGRSLSFGDLAD
ncbi:tRNA pseudouridine(13) synthase TruD, partial [Halorubrum sp. SD612]|uniref:tRNA pseudouridine(13) synthase TruD n=1 Tax=Halorubrum sp. SD612 TaxID=1855863 RepID=UPI000A2D8270